jgi:acyl-CoA synthetase (AMP-forming)/AMP-acid ligase II
VNVVAFLRQVAGAHPDRPALVASGGAPRSITFAELEALTARLAGGLHARGLRAGDRAIVLAPISLHLYAGLIALFRLGATAVFLDPQSSARQLDRTAALIGARAFIGSPRAMWLRWLSPALRRVPLRFRVSTAGARSLGGLAHAAEPRSEIEDVAPASPALITLTSGSTRRDGPRGVARSHQVLAAQHAALTRALPTQAGDVDLPAFPVAVLHNLAAGLTSVIPDFPFRRPDAVRPERILAQIAAQQVTTASGSPAYWDAIAEYCLSHSRSLSLRRIVTGGAPVSARLIQRLAQAAPHTEIMCLYGSTEAEPVAVMPAQEIAAETAALTAAGAGVPLGHPVPDVWVRVLAAGGNECAPGQPGQIWVAGSHVAVDHLDGQGALVQRTADADGRCWHPMGDVAYQDSQGRLWLLGRAHTVIVRAGRTLYPVPVEAAAEALAFVRRAALVGKPDRELGERAVLVIEFAARQRPPTDWQAVLRALCAQQKCPVDEIRALPRLPMDARHNARIDYARLKRGLMP